MNKHLLVAAAAAIAFPCAASAADLPTAKAPPPPVAYVPAFTWTGFYVGGNVGYSWNDDKLSWGYGDWYDPAVIGTDIYGVFPYNSTVAKDGWTGGVQAGYNYQMGSVVIGVEGDINYVDGQKSSSLYWDDGGAYYAVNSGLPYPGATTNIAATDPAYRMYAGAKGGLNWLGTLRGRIGFAADRFMIYGTGGLAFGNIKSSAYLAGDCFDVDNPATAGTGPADFTGACAGATWSGTAPTRPVSGTAGDPAWYRFANLAGSKSSTEIGWTLGGGVEYAMDTHWTVKAEYLYYDLGGSNYAVNGSWLWSPTTGWVAPVVRKDNTGSLARIGVNYKF
jgi:outer membrane immunogenic protein